MFIFMQFPLKQFVCTREVQEHEFWKDRMHTKQSIFFFLNLRSSNILTRTYPPDFLANTFACFRCPEQPWAVAAIVCSPLLQIANVLRSVNLQYRANCSLPSSFVRLPHSSPGLSLWKPNANGVRKTCAVLYIHCQACLSVPHIVGHLRLLGLPLQWLQPQHLLPFTDIATSCLLGAQRQQPNCRPSNHKGNLRLS